MKTYVIAPHTPGPSLDLNFLTGVVDPRVNFTRSSNATYFDATGTLQTAGTNVPRIDYGPNPQTVTNWIRNSAMVGAVVGTPGNAPTNWTIPSSLYGITSQIVGSGFTNGLPYVDVRFFGTTTGVASGANLFKFETSTLIPACANQTWTGSVYMGIVGGSYTNFSGNGPIGIIEYSSAGVIQAYHPSYIGLTSTLTRFVATYTLTSASTAYVCFNYQVSWASGVAIDCTFRVAAPQLELSPFPNAFIGTWGSIATAPPQPLGLLVEESRTNSIRNPRCEGAVVADGIERITNGTFTGTSGTGWTVVTNSGTGTVSFAVTGQASITGDGTHQTNLTQQITTVIGLTYTITVTVATNNVFVQVGPVQGTSTNLGTTVTVGSSRRVSFVATATSTWIGFAITNAATTTVSNISVQSAGAVPTNWILTDRVGLAHQVIGSGYQNGIPFVDVRIYGTPTSTSANNGFLVFDSSSQIAASNSQTWTTSVYLAVVGGSLTNISFSWGIGAYSAAGATFDNWVATGTMSPGSNTAVFPTSRNSLSGTISDASATNINPSMWLTVTLNQVVDVTLRVGCPQMELGAFPTSVILPTVGSPAATTRNAEIPSMSVAGWFNPAQGSLQAVGIPNSVNLNQQNVFMEINLDGFNLIALRQTLSATSGQIAVFTGGAAQAIDSSGSSLSAYTVQTLSGTYQRSVVTSSTQGSLVSTATIGSLPNGLAKLYVGYSLRNAPMNGWLRRIRYWPRALSNTELQMSSGNTYDDFTLDLNFYNGSAINDPRLTFSRSSIATYFDNTGTMQTAISGQPRIDYDPSTLLCRGFLVEESRTNSLRNSTMVGAVAGTPGTLPTYWNDFLSTPVNGVSRQVVAVGVENGISYVDINYSGTPTASSFVYLQVENGNTFSIASGQTWSLSVFAKLSGGSATNVVLDLVQQSNNSSNTFVEGSSATTINLTTASLASQRWSNIYTYANASTAYNRGPFIAIGYTSGQPINITLRIGAPQMELGAFPTSYIPTSTVAVQRQADVCTMPTGAWFNSSAFSMQADYMLGNTTSTTNQRDVAVLSDGTTNNRAALRGEQAGNTNAIFGTFVSGTSTFSNTLITPQPNTVGKIAAAWVSGTQTGAGNGVSVPATTATGIPTGINSFAIGSDYPELGNAYLNGWVRRIRIWSRQLSSTELQQVTR